MVDDTLKKIEFEGTTFYYKVFVEYCEYGDYYWTDFYKTNNVSKLERKYWLFGPLIPVPKNKKVFRLELNIENCNFTKKEIRNKISRKVELIDRCEEIKNGNVI
tara:strand:- start:4303 stop:4614 length:312 start_codon:yes stop_codon:yes gene_type:complete